MFRNSRKIGRYASRVSSSMVKYGDVGSVPIDQTLGKDFNINPDTGLPDYYITRLIRQSNSAGFEQAFAALNEFRSDGLPADMDNERVLDFIKPRSVQTPAEQIAWRAALRSRLQQQRDEKAKLDAARKQEEEDKKLYDSLVSSSKKSE